MKKLLVGVLVLGITVSAGLAMAQGVSPSTGTHTQTMKSVDTTKVPPPNTPQWHGAVRPANDPIVHPAGWVPPKPQTSPPPAYPAGWVPPKKP